MTHEMYFQESCISPYSAYFIPIFVHVEQLIKVNYIIYMSSVIQCPHGSCLVGECKLIVHFSNEFISGLSGPVT